MVEGLGGFGWCRFWGSGFGVVGFRVSGSGIRMSNLSSYLLAKCSDLTFAGPKRLQSSGFV